MVTKSTNNILNKKHFHYLLSSKNNQVVSRNKRKIWSLCFVVTVKTIGEALNYFLNFYAINWGRVKPVKPVILRFFVIVVYKPIHPTPIHHLLGL